MFKRNICIRDYRSALLLYLIIALNKRCKDIQDVNRFCRGIFNQRNFPHYCELQDVTAAIVSDYFTSTDLNNSSRLCKCYSIRFGSYSLRRISTVCRTNDRKNGFKNGIEVCIAARFSG